MLCLVTQSCPTLCDPMDFSLPGSSVLGILQAIILEWVANFIPRGSSQPRDQTQVSYIAGRFFTSWATRETCSLLIRTLIPFRNSILLAKLPPQGWTPNSITLRGRVSTYEFWRDTNIQCKTRSIQLESILFKSLKLHLSIMLFPQWFD